MKQNIFWILVLLLPVMAALPVDRYVATNGTHDGLFTNWAGAATNIQAAVDVATTAGDYVWVSNGVYTTTNGNYANQAKCIVAISNANNITLQSVNGPLVTIIDGGGIDAVPYHRGVYMSTYVTINGFTVRNGYLGTDLLNSGAGISLTTPSGGNGGIITNCVVYNNITGYGDGGGIFVGAVPGYIYNCQIYSNSAYFVGGGVCEMYWTLNLNNSVIWGNKITGTWGVRRGGGIYASRYLFMRNCLVYSNSTPQEGGGIGIEGGEAKSIENCTITENMAGDAGNGGGGVYIADDAPIFFVLNSIIYNNFTTSASGNTDVYTAINQMTNCCIGNTNGIPNWNINGNITNNPIFVNANTNNYRLSENSPCINTGMNQAWMTGAVDLDGRRRIDFLGRQVDIGAYEFIMKGTLFVVH